MSLTHFVRKDADAKTVTEAVETFCESYAKALSDWKALPTTAVIELGRVASKRVANPRVLLPLLVAMLSPRAGELHAVAALLVDALDLPVPQDGVRWSCEETLTRLRGVQCAVAVLLAENKAADLDSKEQQRVLSRCLRHAVAAFAFHPGSDNVVSLAFELFASLLIHAPAPDRLQQFGRAGGNEFCVRNATNKLMSCVALTKLGPSGFALDRFAVLWCLYPV